jgi:hypothetical protein
VETAQHCRRATCGGNWPALNDAATNARWKDSRVEDFTALGWIALPERLACCLSCVVGGEPLPATTSETLRRSFKKQLHRIDESFHLNVMKRKTEAKSEKQKR